MCDYIQIMLAEGYVAIIVTEMLYFVPYWETEGESQSNHQFVF